jgi:hypothetical protein
MAISAMIILLLSVVRNQNEKSWITSALSICTHIHCIPQRMGTNFSSPPELIFIVISGSAKTRPKLRRLLPQGVLFYFRLCLFQLLHYPP